MVTAFAAAAQEWAAGRPRLVEAVTPLKGAVIFSSTQREIVRHSLGLPPAEKPGDIDLLVPPDDFFLAARHLGAAVVERDVRFPTADRRTAYFRTHEAIVHIGPDEVQFMKPLTDMHVGRSRYNTLFTEQGAAAATVVETVAGVLRFAHPVDTIGLYGIMQRRSPKNDLHGAATLLAAGRPLADAYARQRMAEVGWDERVRKFVAQAGGLAVERSGLMVSRRQLAAAA